MNYKVFVPIKGHQVFEVFAENEQEAEDKVNAKLSGERVSGVIKSKLITEIAEPINEIDDGWEIEEV